MAEGVCALWKRIITAKPFFLFCGPNVLQGREHALRLADRIARVKHERKLEIIFKSSFDKANRTSLGSFRGPGIDEGLRILEAVKEATGLPLVTDIHETHQAKAAAQVCDVLQIPAFLCRQTDLLAAAAATSRIIHIKKGQFASADVMVKAAEKVKKMGNDKVILCERGNSFGYSDLIVDYRNLIWMKEGSKLPVVLDVTHCLQQPSARTSSGGELVSGAADPRLIAYMGSAALSVGVSGLFLEVDEDPSIAPCDGKLQWPIHRLDALIHAWSAVAEGYERAGPMPVP